MLLIRRYVLESPRWLASHGRKDQAEEVAGGIEERVREYTGRDELPPVDEDETLTIEQRKSIGFTTVLRAMFQMEMVAVRTAHRSDAGFLADPGARDATRPLRRIRRLPTRED